MRWERLTIGQAEMPLLNECQIATCEKCKGQAWALFRVSREDVTRLQCAACGANHPEVFEATSDELCFFETRE